MTNQSVGIANQLVGIINQQVGLINQLFLEFLPGQIRDCTYNIQYVKIFFEENRQQRLHSCEIPVVIEFGYPTGILFQSARPSHLVSL
jgi:hypothetical protein